MQLSASAAKKNILDKKFEHNYEIRNHEISRI